MFKHLTLTRPLAVIDLETTGTDPQKDRIVEISVLKVYPDGATEHKTRRINPTIPIPPEATAIHGITDADVADEPEFRKLATGLIKFLDGCDFCGFNFKRFDLRMLYAEFQRAGLTLDLTGRAVVDPMEIFHHYERRDLAAAVGFYLNGEHAGAHTAAADVMATALVLDAMVERYDDLPDTVHEMQAVGGPVPVDSGDLFIRINGELQFRRLKHRGARLDEVALVEPSYLTWILSKDFPQDTKMLVKSALAKVAVHR